MTAVKMSSRGRHADRGIWKLAKSGESRVKSQTVWLSTLDSQLSTQSQIPQVATTMLSWPFRMTILDINTEMSSLLLLPGRRGILAP
jgi:hypothetical protein